MNLTADSFDKAELFWHIYKRVVKVVTVKAESDANPHKQINTRRYLGETIQSWEIKKFIISHRFLWNGNAISTQKTRYFSCLNFDVTSHDSLQPKKFSNEAVLLRLMQYLISLYSFQISEEIKKQ